MYNIKPGIILPNFIENWTQIQTILPVSISINRTFRFIWNQTCFYFYCNEHFQIDAGYNIVLILLPYTSAKLIKKLIKIISSVQ